MVEYEVVLLDEVYYDVFYSKTYSGFCCPSCGRMFSEKKGKNNGRNGAKRVVS